MADFLDSYFPLIVGGIIFLTTLSSLGTCYLIFRRFRPKASAAGFQMRVWLVVELALAVTVISLGAAFLTLGRDDRFANGLALYMLLVWSSPAVAFGLVSLALRPPRQG